MIAAPPRHVGFDAGAWLDVTRALVPGHPNWPGDTPFRLTATARKAAGDSVNVMALDTSTHSGTHLDAPYHYTEAGARLDGVPLSDLLGPCLVLDVRDPEDDAAVPATAALAALERVAPSTSPLRVLLRTGQDDVWDTFPTAFRALSLALVATLAQRGGRLIGTDAPSVDAFTSKDLPVHAACAEHGLWIVEGLALATISEGVYEMICLPLRLPTADASPVRALLRPLA